MTRIRISIVLEGKEADDVLTAAARDKRPLEQWAQQVLVRESLESAWVAELVRRAETPSPVLRTALPDPPKDGDDG